MKTGCAFSIRAALMSLLVLCLAPAQADEIGATERAHIEALIHSVETLPSAVFIRNGSEYEAAKAAKFLRKKWEAHADQVHSAQDFIEHIASVSSTSGKPYLIRFSDGRELKSAEFFAAELKKLK